MTFIINTQTEKLSKDLVFQVAEQTAHRYAKEVEALLESAMQDAQVMEIAFWQMKLSNQNRRILDEILIKTTKHDPKILGTWMLWEPNAYDSKDKEFINTEGHDSTGRVNSYWHWEGEDIINEPNIGWEDSSWYNVPRERKKETLLDPYIYEVSGVDTLLISAIQPIIKNDKFHGVVGVDVKLDTLQEMIGKLRVLEVGYSSLIANNGTYVAHPNPELIGKKISEIEKNLEIAKKIQKGEKFDEIIAFDVFTKEESYHISVPINIANTNMPWAFIVSIPTSKIYAPVDSISDLILLIGVLFGVIMILMLMFIVKQFMTPIDNITEKLNEVVNKKDDDIPKLDILREDEVGLLSKSFNIMASNLNQSRNELIIYKNNLEQLVEKRTVELEKSLSNLKKTQKKLIESEKMASLGGLVAGVAHEINTPVGIGLTGITHFLQTTKELEKLYKSDEMSQKDFEDYLETAKDIAHQINDNLEKTASLVKSFKQVAVDQTNEIKRVFNLKEYINAILFSLKNIIKKTQLEFDIKIEEEVILNSYPGIYSQIFTNLIINSIIHGYDDKAKGTIEIKVNKQNNNLLIVFKDDGKGIKEENISKIFEPFFTTNRKHGGTGLGLNVVYNLVTHNLKGTIECNSVEKEGTIFKLNLPLEEI